MTKQEFDFEQLQNKLDEEPRYLKIGEVATIKMVEPRIETTKQQGKFGEYNKTTYYLPMLLKDGSEVPVALNPKQMRDIISKWKMTGKPSELRWLNSPL